MTTANDRSTLDQKLSKLLGFEDGVSSVVEHLLTIESKEDLQDYLSQLLGSSNQGAIQAFVEDVGRFQRGEPLAAVVVVAPEKETKLDKKESAKETATATPSPKKTDARVAQTTQPLQPQSIKKTKVTVPKKAPAAQTSTNAPIDNDSKKTATTDDSEKKPVIPPKGKAPYDCGCFGSLHKALTNCLYCGRIACAKEGYNFCPFCGYMIEERTAKPESVSEQAWELKERLLRYNREGAQRTTVVDDHADYNNSSAWLNQTEAAASAEREEERQNQLHKRQHMQLDLQL